MASKRKYVSTACDTCRESKVKCDGARPACSTCTHKMRPCNYQVGMDKRKISLKFVVDLLMNRLDELSQYIVDQGLPLPSNFNTNDLALKNALDTLGLRHIKAALEGIENKPRQLTEAGEQQSYNSFAMSSDVVASDFDISDIDPDMELLLEPFAALQNTAPRHTEFESESSPSSSEGVSIHSGSGSLMGEVNMLQEVPDSNRNENTLSLPPQLPFGSEEQLVKDGPVDQSGNEISTESRKNIPHRQSSKKVDDSGIEDLIHQLSYRMGSLQVGSDGQIRYYGPTSHFNLLRMPTPDGLTIHRTVRKDGHDYLQRMGVDKDVPVALEDHLINLFFAWHSPTVNVVSRGMYEMAKQQWKVHVEETAYYSEALTNAMCCLGAAFEPRYHPNFITYPRSLSDFFADRAKTLLDIELDSPTIATVQAMVVLSGHDIGCKRDSRGWLYSGMAMRLAFDLGLHLDMSAYVEDGTITEAEADLRSMVFWGAYTLDHHWGFLLGRPFRVSLEDVTVPQPSSNMGKNETHPWYPYGLPFPTSYPLEQSLISPTTLLDRYRIELCEIMTPLGHALYGSKRASRESLQLLNENTTKRLLDWKNRLPVPLQIHEADSTPSLPHALLLHLQYHQSLIHAHRPWMSQNHIQPQPQQGPGFAHARKMCVSSALSISSILHQYEKFYTFRRMNIQAVAITCSAALILIFAKILDRDTQEKMKETGADTHGNDETVSGLNVCFRALEEFGSSWESAKRAQTFLLRMQGLMESRSPSSRSMKRRVPGSEGVRAASGRKRSCTLSASGGSYGSDRVGSDGEDFDWLWATAMGAMSSR